ncbi:MAG: hypothetical protein U5N56_07530 [Candidatus Marinimicrobia bacterium]|nr:hypothetical protein [Candidatus Neomarinimicrobiota bacterium]
MTGKKRICFLLLCAAVLTLGADFPRGEFFDDFHYADPADSLILENGWNIVDGIHGPPRGAHYSRDNISFSEDSRHAENRFMYLTASTQNIPESMVLARIESALIFHEGTYAARVFFDNHLRKTRDGNVQTFYTINTLRFPNDTLYSECDMEYLPYDLWHADGNTKSKLYLSTWGTYQEDPWKAVHASDTLYQHQAGWHVLLFQVTGGKSVTYFLDRYEKAIAEHYRSPQGLSVYPESLMRISFANWIIARPGVSPGISEERRESMMGVDWIYHAKDTALTVPQVIQRVREMQKASVYHVNTMEE